MQALADVAELACEARLDRHVDVLFAVREHELARRSFVVHGEQRATELARVVGLEQTYLAEHRHVRRASEDVLPDERPVLGQRGAPGEELGDHLDSPGRVGARKPGVSCSCRESIVRHGGRSFLLGGHDTTMTVASQ